MDTKTFDVPLRVTGIDLDSVETGAVLAERFPDVVWEELNDLVVMTLILPSHEMMDRAVEVCRQMEAAIPGFSVNAVYRDLVNATDIALRMGLSRETVRKWSTREDFPQPYDVVGGDSMKVWAWTQVVSWLRDVRGIDVDEALPSLAEMTQLENCLMKNPDHTTVRWQDIQRAKSPAPIPKAQPVQQRVFVDAVAGHGHGGTSTPRPSVVVSSDELVPVGI